MIEKLFASSSSEANSAPDSVALPALFSFLFLLSLYIIPSVLVSIFLMSFFSFSLSQVFTLTFSLPWISILFALSAAFLYARRPRKVPGLPSPGFYPFVGHLLGMSTDFHRFHDYLQDLSRSVGEEKCLSLGLPMFFNSPRRFIYLGADERLSEYFLRKNFNNYIKGDLFDEIMRDFLGDGIFNADGELWRKHRKIASYMFTARHLREDMTKVFLRNGEVVAARLNELAARNEEFDIQDIFFRYTLDSFSEIAFGENPHCLTRAFVPFAKAFDTVQFNCNLRFTSPSWKIKKFFNVGSERIIRQQKKILDDYAFQVIARRKAMKGQKIAFENLKDTTDLLTRFILHSIHQQEEENNAAEQPASSQQHTENHMEAAEPLTDSEMKDVVLNFIIAGRDTTACLLSWSTYELTQHPEWEAQLLAAIQEKFQQTKSYEECGQLPIVQHFIHEALRLHPSVPIDAKRAVYDDTLPDGTPVKGGDYIIYAPYHFNRAKCLWGADAEEFKPQRWEKENPSEFKFLAFNAGPRLCLGKRVAVHETGLLFAMLIHQFQVQLSGHSRDSRVTYLPTVTLPIKDGLIVKLSKRM